MKKFVLLTGCLLILTLAASAQANQYYVSTSGNNSNDGSQARPWQTINKAIASFTSGSGGAVVHVAAGNYSNTSGSNCFGVAVCFTRGGASQSARLVVQCDTPQQCFINTTVWFNGSNVNNIDFVGFDVGNMPDDSNGISTANNGTSSTYNSIHLINNYVHDIGQNVTYNGILGCMAEGMITLGPPHGASFQPTDIQVIGNRLNNFGRVGNACNNAQGIYLGGGGGKIQNNIVSNIASGGIQVYDQPCNTIISNNVVFHNGNGIRLGGGGCSGHNTVINNIIVDSVPNSGNGVLGIGILGSSGSGGSCPIGSTLYGNNMFHGNVSDFGSTGTCEVKTGNITSEAPTATFVNYRTDGSGDYSLKAGSLAIGAGTTSCVAGGASPCVPTISIAGLLRPMPPSIGANEFGTSANQPPDAPANLTATVQ